MNIDFGKIVSELLQQAMPQIVQAVSAQLQGHHQNPQAQQASTGMVQQGAGLFAGSAPQTAAVQQAATQGIAAGGNMFGGTAPQTATAQPTVTPDMIQTLISPLVQNEQVKAALTAQMQQMGIQNLPDARPEQLGELYQRFTTVRDQAQAAGLLGGNAGSPSII